ncbi:FAD-dependent monooxygenase [Streptomyces sp. NPDC048489]|uniref:FAD-dependent monooxygenase n=1 Tax=Streptomyces sp. NPDC048489 TaxID=3154504 RepID=UPI0034148FC3
MQVLVVGSGPVGLVAACELARRGVAVRLIDAADGPPVGSRGKGLQPRTIELLDDLGVVGQILAAGRFRLPVRRYQGTNILSTSELNAEAQEPGPATPYTRTMLIPQWRVEEVLREKIASYGIAVEYGSRLENLEQDDNVVHAAIVRESKSETVEASYVVGCDGASSMVRKLVGIKFLGETDETTRMLTADIELSGLDRDFWHWWPDSDGGLLALCPLAATSSFQLQTILAADSRGDLSREEIQSLISVRSGRSDIEVRNVLWKSIWRSNVRMVDRYRNGRVFLAGDAAHVHSPAGGLGMNTGIQDAYNLGWKISHVLNGAHEHLLDTYEEERLPVAADVLGLSSKLHSKHMAGIVPKEGQSRDTLQLTLSYPESSLNENSGEASIVEGFPPGNAVRAGDRAPDSQILDADGKALRIFDFFRGPHITVLAFGRQSLQIANLLAERYPRYVRSLGLSFSVSEKIGPSSYPATTMAVDHLGYSRRDYGITGDVLFVIRPDGYVGMRSDKPNETDALRYVSQLLPQIDT